MKTFRAVNAKYWLECKYKMQKNIILQTKKMYSYKNIYNKYNKKNR